MKKVKSLAELKRTLVNGTIVERKFLKTSSTTVPLGWNECIISDACSVSVVLTIAKLDLHSSLRFDAGASSFNFNCDDCSFELLSFDCKSVIAKYIIK